MISVSKTSDTNDLGRIKHLLLAVGSAKATGVPFQLRSRPPPVRAPEKAYRCFFSDGISRIRLTLDEMSPVHIENYGDSAVLTSDGPEGPVFVEGFVEKTGCHCPKQAYITINEGCIFSCRYCTVPNLNKHIKTPDEIVSLITDACSRDTIACISLTSGVIGTMTEEDERLFTILERVRSFGLPIGVSVYPTPGAFQKTLRAWSLRGEVQS